MADVPWLDARELEAWRRLQLMQLQLSAVLSRELGAEAGLSYQDYLVLAALTDCPGDRMRAFALGRELGWEKSRLSHHVDRMAERGLVERERCETDQRGAYVVATARGRAAIEAAAPRHVRSVRRHFIDLLDRGELALLSDVAGRVLDHLAEPPHER